MMTTTDSECVKRRKVASGAAVPGAVAERKEAFGGLKRPRTLNEEQLSFIASVMSKTPEFYDIIKRKLYPGAVGIFLSMDDLEQFQNAVETMCMLLSTVCDE